MHALAKSRRWLLWPSLLVVLVIAASTAATTSGGTFDRATARCPQGVRLTAAALDIDNARRAAARLIPRVYPTKPPGEPERALIVQLALLEPQQPELPGAAQWRAIGRRRCSAQVVDASWLVVAIFPDHKVVVPTTGVFFIALTRSGWQAWYRLR